LIQNLFFDEIKILNLYILDVSGGNFPSILDVMRAALQVSIHLSFSKLNYKPLNYKDVFYMATLGGAEGKI